MKNKLQEEYPNYNQTDFMRKAAERWLQIDPMIKQNLQKQYYEQISLYRQKLMDYENSLTVEQKFKVIQKLLDEGHSLNDSKIKNVFILR